MKWLYGILCLFFLIIFHEFGHFIAAKLCGVKVESFSVGFGPILLHKKIRGTDWRLSLIPLGGYCGMKGEKDFQKAIDENKKEIEAEPDSLYGVHPLKRALIGVAGPIFNLIFAFLAFIIISAIGYTYYTYSNTIILSDELYENTHSAARDAGLLTGDKIIQIGKNEITDFSDIISEISIRPDEDVLVIVDRNGKIIEFTVHTDMNKEEGTGKIGVSADTSNVLTKETPHYGFFGCIANGFKETFNTVKLTFKSIKILFKGVKVTSAVSGPARVTDLLGTSVQEGFKAGARVGFVSLFNLMGLISVSLFIMNLLPVPVLDGGLVLIAFIEFISRKKIRPKVQYYIQFIGLGFIAILFVIGLFGDISYFIHK